MDKIYSLVLRVISQERGNANQAFSQSLNLELRRAGDSGDKKLRTCAQQRA